MAGRRRSSWRSWRPSTPGRPGGAAGGPSPASAGDPKAPLQAIVTNLDASDYLGRLAIGRVVQGTLRQGEQVALCHSNEEEPPLRRRLGSLLGFEGLGRVDVPEREAGDLFVVAGFPEVEIGDTLDFPVCAQSPRR